jgi:chitodextrinase
MNRARRADRAAFTVDEPLSSPTPNLFAYDFEEAGTPPGLTLSRDPQAIVDPDAPTAALRPAAPDRWGAHYLRTEVRAGKRAFMLVQPARPLVPPLHLECGMRVIVRPTFAANGEFSNVARFRFTTAENLPDPQALSVYLRIGRFALGSGHDYRWSWALRHKGAQLNSSSIPSSILPVADGAHVNFWIRFLDQTFEVMIDDQQLLELNRSDWTGIDEIRFGCHVHLGPQLVDCAHGFDNFAANVENFPSLLYIPEGLDSEPPTAPNGLAATVISSSQIDLNWRASTDNIRVAGYEVFRDGEWIGETTDTGFSDLSSAPETSYRYKVRAKDANDNLSPFSAEVVAATPEAPDTTPPTVPDGLDGRALSSSQVRLTWNSSTDDRAVTGYDVFRDGVRIGGATTTSFQDTGLSPGTAYCYQVRARDAAGNTSALTAVRKVTTQNVAAATTVRGATGIVITYNPEYGTGPNSSFAGLASIAHLLTKCTYAPPGQMTTARNESGNWVYDHSPAGINAGGDKLGAFAEAAHRKHGARMVWVDIEQWHSRNVPDPLTDGRPYTADDGYFANTDYVTSRPGLRKEVVRFRLAILERAREYLRSRGLGFIEFADYNLPRKLNISERAILSTDARITFEPVNFSLYTDAIDAGGPQTQYIVRQAEYDRIVKGTGNGLTIGECTAWLVNGVRTRMQAYAAAGKVLRPHCCVWPILFVVGGKTHGVLPPGTMTDLLNQLYAIGVRRFGAFHWHGITSVWDDSTLRNAAHASYAELAAWALAKGSEVQKIG